MPGPRKKHSSHYKNSKASTTSSDGAPLGSFFRDIDTTEGRASEFAYLCNYFGLPGEEFVHLSTTYRDSNMPFRHQYTEWIEKGSRKI